MKVFDNQLKTQRIKKLYFSKCNVAKKIHRRESTKEAI